jgi:hypothetical protein
VVLVAAVLALAGGLVLRAEAAGSGSRAAIVHTGYGDVRVEHAEAVRGLDPHDLGGAAHGIAGLVNRDQVLVQVTLLVTGNGSGKALDGSRFRLSAGGEPVAPATSSLAKGKVPAGANVEGTLGFVAAMNASRVVLSIPDGTTAVDVDLHPKAVDGSPTGAGADIGIDPNGAVTIAPDDGSGHHHDGTGTSVAPSDPSTDDNGGPDQAATPSGTGNPASGTTPAQSGGTGALRTGGIDDQVKHR